jgi:hypothetical protein
MGRGVVVVVALAAAGCGHRSPPSVPSVEACLRHAGATFRKLPRPGSHEFVVPLTDKSFLEARGALPGKTLFQLFASAPEAADLAQQQAIDFQRLFGLGPDTVLRNGTLVLLLTPPRQAVPHDREIAKGCLA